MSRKHVAKHHPMKLPRVRPTLLKRAALPQANPTAPYRHVAVFASPVVHQLPVSPLNSPVSSALKIALRATRERRETEIGDEAETGVREEDTRTGMGLSFRGESSQAMEWWDRMIFPAKRVWIGVAARFSLRKNGLKKLRQEVSNCEYEDVRVMWEILRRSEVEIARSPPLNDRQAKKHLRRWVVFDWPPYNLCASF